MRRVRRAGVLALLAGLLLVLGATPASAHAALLHSDPHDRDVLGDVPTQVVLTFSEPVATSLGAVKVLAPDGSRVDTGRTRTREGRTEVVAPLLPDLAEGTYVLLWRVVSEDSHPVSGASTFSVGRASTPSAVAGSPGDGAAAGRLLTATRGLLSAGLVLLVGGLAFVLGLWREGVGVRAVRRLLWAGWAATALGSAGALLLQGPYAAGLPVTRALDGALLGEVLGTRLGSATVARLALLLPAAVLLLALGRASRAALLTVGLPVAAGLLLTTSLVGHAAAGDLTAVALPLDVLHLAAAATWLGGLTVLGVALLRRPDPARLAAVLPRWSRWATGSVLVLVVTGTFAGWREVRDAGALPGTGYGRLLLLKLLLVAGMLLLGLAGRTAVRRHWTRPVVLASTVLAPPVRPQPAPADLGRLRRGVLLEAGTAAAVLAVTAVLVEHHAGPRRLRPSVQRDPAGGRRAVGAGRRRAGPGGAERDARLLHRRRRPRARRRGGHRPAHLARRRRRPRGRAQEEPGPLRAAHRAPARRGQLAPGADDPHQRRRQHDHRLPAQRPLTRPVPERNPSVRTRRLLVPAAGSLLLLLPLAGTASAHVTVQGPGATQGGYTKLTFRVPSEKDVPTTKIEIAFPTDTPIASLRVKPHAGWTAQLVKGAPATPLEVHGEKVTEVVQRIVWTAAPGNAGIGATEFDEFEVSAGPLPTTDTLVFKALQTYADGEVVRWIEEAAPGGAEPEKPAPVLQLAAPAPDAVPVSSTTAAGETDEAGSGSSGLAGAALGVSVLALLAAGFSLVTRRRSA